MTMYDIPKTLKDVTLVLSRLFVLLIKILKSIGMLYVMRNVVEEKQRMNLTQIRDIYLSQVQEKLNYAFIKIEQEMVHCYKDISIDVYDLNRASSFPKYCFDDMVNGIIEHYSENWNVKFVIESKKVPSHFVFHYIGYPLDHVYETIKCDTKIVEKAKTVVNRTQILDFDNVNIVV